MAEGRAGRQVFQPCELLQRAVALTAPRVNERLAFNPLRPVHRIGGKRMQLDHLLHATDGLQVAVLTIDTGPSFASPA